MAVLLLPSLCVWRVGAGGGGAIDKKYDVAVSTACSMLDAIVVDTVEDGQKVLRTKKCKIIEHSRERFELC